MKDSSVQHKCSHKECDARMNAGTVIPIGWTVCMVEKYSKNSVSFFYLYMCPRHTVSTVENQTSLFQNEVPK